MTSISFLCLKLPEYQFALKKHSCKLGIYGKYFNVKKLWKKLR